MYEQPYAKMKDGAMPQIPVPGEVRAGGLLRALVQPQAARVQSVLPGAAPAMRGTARRGRD
jgi:hypothetical protein